MHPGPRYDAGLVRVPRTVLHVDMDAFYASIEQKDEPSLRGRPVLVGGRSRRSVVCAASYEARPFGVRSAMPMGQALRLCPTAVVVPPRMTRYLEESDRVLEVFHRYTPLVEPLSIDEAFLDVSASESLFGDGVAIARSIKESIRQELGLIASAGVAPSKFVAKIASDLQKPDALVVVSAKDVHRFLAPLPIERMWGVGPKTAPRLRSAGFATFADLAAAQPGDLEARFGALGLHVAALARGEDFRAVIPDVRAKSIGAEETYENDLSSREGIEATLLWHAGRVARRLVRAGLMAQTVLVKLKYSNFRVVSRQARLQKPACDTDTLFETACTLLSRFPAGTVRLTGLAASGLTAAADVPAALLPDDRAERRSRLEALSLAISEKYGDSMLTRARLLEPDGFGNQAENAARTLRRRS